MFKNPANPLNCKIPWNPFEPFETLQTSLKSFQIF